MSTYPLEAGEALPFVPSSLRNLTDLPNPPTFYLRWGTPREKERMRWILDEEGCVIFSDEAMRAELLKGMHALLDADDAAAWEPQAKAWWDAVDQFQKEHSDTKPDDMPLWEYEDEARIVEVLEQIGRDWHAYRVMNAENNKYRRMQGHAINAVIIERFENIDVPQRKRGRYFDVDAAMLIAEELDAIGRKHNPDADTRPARELGIECLQRLFLDKEREGNSASPAPSEPTPQASKNGEESASGKSKASAPSPATPVTA
jgi:hypothetical protein